MRLSPTRGSTQGCWNGAPLPANSGRETYRLELRLNAADSVRAAQALEKRCAGFTADLAALARAFCESNAKVDDQAQGIKTLMDMLESTATHRQLSELEERLTARFDKQISVVKAEHQAQVHAVVASAKQDSVELDVWREWVAGQFGRLSERSWLGGGTSSSRCSRAR